MVTFAGMKILFPPVFMKDQMFDCILYTNKICEMLMLGVSSK